MISSANFEKILRASRKYKVAKIILEDGEITEIQFWAPGVGVVPAAEIVQSKDNVPVVQAVASPFKDIQSVFSDIPSDEEFRYYHSPIVPAPDPIPQEEQRKVS